MLSFICVDLETTGFSPQKDEIISIAGIKVKDGKVASTFYKNVQPVRPIPPSVEQLTGLSYEDLAFEDPIEIVLPEFFRWCENYDLLGHNLTFDYNFLKAHGERVGCDFSIGKTRMGYCTLKLARKNLNLESNKLKDLCIYYNINTDLNFHNAMTDAKATMRVFYRLCKEFPKAIEPYRLDENSSNYGKAVAHANLSFN